MLLILITCFIIVILLLQLKFSLDKNNINKNVQTIQMEQTNELERLKMKIEKLEKEQQIEILRILHENQNVKLNENKSGVYVNLSFLPEDVIDKIKIYLNYVTDQESMLKLTENKKEDFAKTFFEESQDNIEASSIP